TPKFATDGRLSGELRAQGNIFRYENFNGRVGQSDLAGSLSYDSARERPQLSGKVVSESLQFSDLGAVVGSKQPHAQSDHVLPDVQFRVERWRAMDADVDFTGTRIAELPIRDVQTRIVMDNGVLTLKPLRFTIAGGRADSELRLDSTAAPPAGSLTIAARHLKLNAMFPSLEAMRASIGEVNGDLSLKGSGPSIAGILGDADGEVKLLVDNGTISKAALETAGLNLANIVITRLFGDEQVRINCAASDFVVDNGVLNSRLFLFDTDDALIRVDGTVDLAHEQLDLTIHPDAKRLRLLSLRSPLHVTGTFKKVDVSVDKRSLFVRGGGAVALGALAPVAALVPLIAPSGETQNACAGVVSQMRMRATPQASAPAKKT
ncbi:MAG TPA: AsmA family protein, partial [Rudaea sp.]